MKEFIAVLMIMALGLGLTGCGYKELNAMIAANNALMLKTYAEGMKACGDDDGCQVGVSMAFAGRMGQQDLIKPETAKDYIATLLPVATMLFQWYTGGGGSGGGASIKGDNNQLYFMKDVKMVDSQNYVQILPTQTQSWLTSSQNPVTTSTTN